MYKRLSLLSLALSLCLNAASISFNPTEQTGGDAANVLVSFSDTSQAGSIAGTVTVQPTSTNPNVGDIRAIYFNLVNLPTGIASANVLAAISGPGITSTALNTSNVGGQANVNPLGPFSIGLEFGTPGIGADDIRSTTFRIDNSALTPDLTLANIGSVAVRVTSIGIPGSSRSGSGKFLDLDSQVSASGDVAASAVPEPSTYVLAGSALLLLGLSRYRR